MTGRRRAGSRLPRPQRTTVTEPFTLKLPPAMKTRITWRLVDETDQELRPLSGVIGPPLSGDDGLRPILRNLRWTAVPLAKRTRVGKDDVTFVRYRCVVEWFNEDEVRANGVHAASVGRIAGFHVMHRLEEGNLVLAAKVLAAASVEPGYERYRQDVEFGNAE